MNPQEYVQPIVVSRATHADTIAAVAAASLMVWLRYPDEPGWAPWFDASIVKTVRRASDADWRRLNRHLAEHPLPSSEVLVDGAEAIAFAPMLYADLPKSIMKMQVSGTDFERASTRAFALAGERTIQVLVREDLSTGKAAAQAAHALGLAVLADPPRRRPRLQVDVLPVSAVLAAAAHEAGAVVVRDAGRTEVDPGTITAVALG